MCRGGEAEALLSGAAPAPCSPCCPPPPHHPPPPTARRLSLFPIVDSDEVRPPFPALHRQRLPTPISAPKRRLRAPCSADGDDGPTCSVASSAPDDGRHSCSFAGAPPRHVCGSDHTALADSGGVALSREGALGPCLGAPAISKQQPTRGKGGSARFAAPARRPCCPEPPARRRRSFPTSAAASFRGGGGRSAPRPGALSPQSRASCSLFAPPPSLLVFLPQAAPSHAPSLPRSPPLHINHTHTASLSCYQTTSSHGQVRQGYRLVR